MAADSSSEKYLKNYVSHVVAKRHTAAVFLDCLDTVEFVGARWICCVPLEEFKPAMQKHIIEELGHHELLSKVSVKLRLKFDQNELYNWQQMSALAREATENYLLKLFRRCASAIVSKAPKANRNRNCYYLLSLLLERRLMSIYPHLLESACAKEIKDAVAQLLSDEKRHLADVNAGIRPVAEKCGLDLNAMIKIESKLANEWAQQLATITGFNYEDGAALSGTGRPISNVKTPALA